MKIFLKQKLEELLASNWTKFIDYKSLLDIVTNNVLLYAPNWSTIQSSINIKTKKIYISKFEITENNNFRIWINFEIPINHNFATGALELQCNLLGQYEITNCVGNIYS